MKTHPLLALALAAGLLSGCSRAPQGEIPAAPTLTAQELAVVEGRPIRLAEFTAELERRSHGRSGAFARPEDREALLEELIRTEVLHLRALEAGLDRRPDIARQIRRFLAERYREEHFPDAGQLPPVTESELAAAYAAQRDRFTVPAEIRFAVIRLGSPPRADTERKAAVLERAEALLAHARTEEAVFGELARRHSEDQATRYRGGDAGWL
ncbi:MAG TPA: peptidylprolyl isomerase, partial [Verrucomicrobiota bacterium]|nr:peptidylprolyl isomerase [Verrucomicrobiota bacterium]